MGPRSNAAPVAALCLVATSLAGCASHVKGSWACALQPGVVCGSIADIDRGGPPKSAKGPVPADPVIEGAIPARLWGQGGWTAGSIAGAPIREPDPILKIALAPWVDGVGDYHAAAEVYAVMRQGGWFLGPRQTDRRVDLDRLARPAPPTGLGKGPVAPLAAPGPAAPANPDKK